MTPEELGVMYEQKISALSDLKRTACRTLFDEGCGEEPGSFVVDPDVIYMFVSRDETETLAVGLPRGRYPDLHERKEEVDWLFEASGRKAQRDQRLQIRMQEMMREKLAERDR